MSYIGNKPATSFETVQKQISTSNSGTTITLDRAVTSVQDILLTIDAVVQSYDNYSVSGTTLTVGGTLNNNRVEILYVGRTMQSVDPTDDSVSAAKIKTDAVTTAKVQNDAITVDKLNLISTSSVPSLEAKGDGSSVAGKIIWNCENNSHGQTIQAAPHSSGQSWTLKLPDNSPTADKFLKVKSITGSGSTATGQLEFAEAGGGLVPVGQVDSGGNVGEITLDNKFSATYTNYLVIVDKMNPASNGANILFRFRDDTPSTISTSAYGLVSRAYRANDNGLSSRSGDAENTFQLTDAGVSNSSNKMGFKMAMWVHNPFTSTVYTATHGTFQYHNNSGYSTGGYFQMQLHENSSPRGVVMYASTGNINGRIKIYGVVDS